MVSDFFLSETAERADVVLPSAQWTEEEGTMTNLEGRVILRGGRQAMPPPVGVRTGLEVLAALAERLGYGPMFPADPAQVLRGTAARLRGRSGRLLRDHLRAHSPGRRSLLALPQRHARHAEGAAIAELPTCSLVKCSSSRITGIGGAVAITILVRVLMGW